MMTYFLSALPLYADLENRAASRAQSLRPLGELTCVYLFARHVSSPKIELPVTLSYEHHGESFKVNKFAYRYTIAEQDSPFDVYTLPALISINSLSIGLKKLAYEAMSKAATAIAATAPSSSSAPAATGAIPSAIPSAIPMASAIPAAIPGVADSATATATASTSDADDTAATSAIVTGAGRAVPSLRLRVSVEGEFLGEVDFVLVDSDSKSPNFEEYYFKYLERWLSFFDYLINYNHVGLYSSQNILRFAYLNNLLNQYCGSAEQPSRSRILAIAERASAPLSRIANKLRKSLINTRKLMPVERVNAMDGKCLEYLLRLEGDTLKEKAQKNKMRILGLTKEETYNLLENRVLKDFLVRCSNKSTQYLLDIKEQSRNNPQLSNSLIEKQMKIFKQRCLDLATKSPLEIVPRQGSLPKPNFVLQKDPDYKKIWKMYLDLIHEKRDLDKNLYCQQYLFQDICDLLTNAALCSLCEDDELTQCFSLKVKTIAKSFAFIEREQINGHRLRSGCNAGPFLISSPQGSFSLEVLSFGSQRRDPLQALKGYEGVVQTLGAPSYLLIQPVLTLGQLHQEKRVNKVALVPLYSLHALLSDKTVLEQLVREQSNELLKLKSLDGFKSAPRVASGVKVLSQAPSRNVGIFVDDDFSSATTSYFSNQQRSHPRCEVKVQLYPCTLVSCTRHYALQESYLFRSQEQDSYLKNEIVSISDVLLGHTLESAGLKVHELCPACFVSALSVRPDEWLHGLHSIKLMLLSILNKIACHEN